MPAISPITINDGADTPVAHTFNPDRIDSDGVARFREQTGVYVGDNTLSTSLKTNATKIKSRALLALPITATEVVNGVSSPKVIRTSFADVNFTFDKASTTQERDDAITLLMNLMGTAIFRSVVVDTESIY